MKPELLRRERAAMAGFLVALAEFDRQKLWVELGHASLFSFLRLRRWTAPMSRSPTRTTDW